MSTWSNKNALFLSTPVAQLLAITAYGEAASEGGEGMMAVLNVIRNRTQFSEFYDNEIYNLTSSLYHAVILKQNQFSMFNIGNSVRPVAERFASNFDSIVASNGNLALAYNLAQMLLANQLNDNTGGATHYHATYVSPSWASTMPMTGQIGQHIFYASRAVAPPTAVVQTVSYTPEGEEEYVYEEIPVETMEAGFGASPVMIFILLGLAAAIVYGYTRR